MKKYFLICLTFLLTVTGAGAAGVNLRVVLETNFGDIVIELYPEAAPITVSNFLSYVNSGFYDGIVFHRAIDQFMIQAGAFYIKGIFVYPKPPAYGSIINEGDNGLRNVRGTISTALSDGPHTATSQFFINQVYNFHLDHDYADGNGYGHCVFGTVIEGMDVVDSIALIDLCNLGGALTHFPCNPPAFIHTAYELPCELSYCSNVAPPGRISFEDFALFAAYWLDENCTSANGFCNGADLDYSGGVDVIDLDLFWSHWTRSAGHESRFSDLAYDNTINSTDLSGLVVRWLHSDCTADNNYCDRADINRDGTVDFTDFSLLSGNWLSSY